MKHRNISGITLTHKNICLEEAELNDQEQYVADLNKETLIDLNERYFSLLEKFVEQYAVYPTVKDDISHIRANLDVLTQDVDELRAATLRTVKFLNDICVKYHIIRVNYDEEEE